MNIYEIINSKITDLLEHGTIPWRKPWNAASNQPKNLITNKNYRGINIFMLACQPYGSPYWLTYRQLQDKGGHVIKGSKATPVIFWKWLDNKDITEHEESSPTGKIPMLRYYNVFNLDQTEGIPIPEPVETHNDHQALQEPEQIIKSMPVRPDIRFGGNRAYYSPTLDYIQLPHLHSFDSPEEYYCTLFHEIAHSTGHSMRLGRRSIQEASYFGSHEYSKEELVAEMGAAFLCGITGIEQRTIVNSAAYIRGWLKELKNDKTLLIHAAAQAQNAADFILNRQGGETGAAVDAEAA